MSRSRNMPTSLIKALERSGWSADRCVDTSKMAQEFQRRGIAVHNPGLEVLSAIGGLTVSDPLRPKRVIIFDPIRCLHPYHLDDLADLETATQLGLCPVGGDSEEEILLIAASGKAFVLAYSTLYAVDGDVWEGVDHVLHKRIDHIKQEVALADLPN